jgi:hypothetical protein
MDNPPAFVDGPSSVFIDWAGVGGDEVVVAHCQGNRVVILDAFLGTDEAQIIGRVGSILRKHGYTAPAKQTKATPQKQPQPSPAAPPQQLTTVPLREWMLHVWAWSEIISFCKDDLVARGITPAILQTWGVAQIISVFGIPK